MNDVDDAAEVGLAVGELMGALTYGQLRAFVAVAATVPLAPDLATGRRLADFAVSQHARYQQLQQRLDELTDLGSAVMERQRPTFDAFFDEAFSDWLGACVHLAAGLPIAADFAEAVAPTVDDESARVLRSALGGRDDLEAYATALLQAELDAGGLERARTIVAEQLGAAITGFQQAAGRTDALKILFAAHAEESGRTSEGVVREVFLRTLTGHRRRMHALGLDDPE